MASNPYRIPGQAEICQDNGRPVRVVQDLARQECSCPAEPAEEHLSAWIFEACSPSGQIRAREPVRGRVTVDMQGLRIESGNAVVGAHPKIAAAIVEHAAQGIAGKPITLTVNKECARLSIELVQTVLSAHPHGCSSIEQQRVHPIVAQRRRIVDVMLVGLELAGYRIETLQA